MLNPNVIVAAFIALWLSFFAGIQYEISSNAKEVVRLSAVMQEKANELRTQHEQEKQDAQKTITKLRSDVNAGAIRLSIRSNSGNTSAGTPETRTELDRQTAQDLITITTDGDEAIRDLNYCIDRYNKVKDTK